MHKIALLLLTTLAVIAAGCSTRPWNVLSREKMKAVTHDILLAETYADQQGLPDSVRLHYYQTILDKHNVSQQKYDSTLLWYGRHPNRLTEIYKELGSELQAKKGTLDAYIQDSLHLRRTRLADTTDLITPPATRRLYIGPNQGYYSKLFHLDLNSIESPDTLRLQLRALYRPTNKVELLSTLTLVSDSLTPLYFWSDTVRFGNNHGIALLPLPDSLPNIGQAMLRFSLLAQTNTTWSKPIILDHIYIESYKQYKEHIAQQDTTQLPSDSIAPDSIAPDTLGANPTAPLGA